MDEVIVATNRKRRLWLFLILLCIGVFAVGLGGGYVFITRFGDDVLYMRRVVDSAIWRVRRSSGNKDNPRKSGKFVLANGLMANYCGEPDGTVKSINYNGIPTEREYMITHIYSVNADGTITVRTVRMDSGSGTRVYTPSSVEIVEYPEFQEHKGSLRDLEEGDCVLIFGVEVDRPVKVLGVR